MQCRACHTTLAVYKRVTVVKFGEVIGVWHVSRQWVPRRGCSLAPRLPPHDRLPTRYRRWEFNLAGPHADNQLCARSTGFAAGLRHPTRVTTWPPPNEVGPLVSHTWCSVHRHRGNRPRDPGTHLRLSSQKADQRQPRSGNGRNRHGLDLDRNNDSSGGRIRPARILEGPDVLGQFIGGNPEFHINAPRFTAFLAECELRRP